MNRARRLDPLLQQRKGRQDEIAREVAQRQQQVEQQQQRLDMLRDYAREYDRLPQDSGAVATPALLANRVAFRAKVAEAVLRQSELVEAVRRQHQSEHHRLVDASRATKVVEQLQHNYRQDAARAEQRRDQRQLDDLAGRNRGRPMVATDSGEDA